MSLGIALSVALQAPISVEPIVVSESRFKTHSENVIVVDSYYDDVFIDDYYESIILEQGSFLYDELTDEFIIFSIDGRERIYRDYF
ncbi:hypothetical protein [Vibrio pelagius]|uniref:hypothetical protein n=1 Tax=Vibrio pelagius TaxID=28169 RepID=UPI0021C3D9CB|nr:hypothetical protein [Vibrio pelagius]